MVFGTLYYKAFGKKHDHHNKEESEAKASGSTSKERDVEFNQKTHLFCGLRDLRMLYTLDLYFRRL